MLFDCADWTLDVLKLIFLAFMYFLLCMNKKIFQSVLVFLHIVLSSCLLCFSKVLPAEEKRSWNWFFILYDTSASSERCCSSLALLSSLPSLPPCSLALAPWLFSCKCDRFCNEGSLMWSGSRVSWVLSWVGGKECEAGSLHHSRVD